MWPGMTKNHRAKQVAQVLTPKDSWLTIQQLPKGSLSIIHFQSTLLSRMAK